MQDKQIQGYLFQRIKERLPSGSSLVETVAEVLHISQDSAYRRIRGETPLVLEEAKALCQQYSLSLDQLFGLTDHSVVFENRELSQTANDVTSYLHSISFELKKLQDFEQKTITYLTNDIPFFYWFCHQPLFAFCYFFWMKNVFKHPAFAQQKFSLDCLPPETELLGKEVLSLYCNIASTEIWNTECINNNLGQIAHYVDTGMMTREDACSIYEALYKTVEHLQVQAEYGSKFLPGENPHSKKTNYQLFHNRAGTGDDTILITSGEAKKLYINYDALSYLTTTDEAFCHTVRRRLQNVMRRGTLISNVSEKQRNIFFNILYAKFPLYEANKIKLVT